MPLAPTASPTLAPSALPTATSTRTPIPATATRALATATPLPTAVPPSATPAPAQPAGIAALTQTEVAEVADLAWAPDGKVLALAGPQGISLRDGRTLAEVQAIEAGAAVRAVAFSPDGRLLAAGTRGNVVQLWDVAARQLVRTLEGPNLPVESAAYNPAAAELARVAFGPDGAMLAAAVAGYYSGGLGSVWRWRVATGKALEVLSTYGPPTDVAFSPDGAILAVATAVNSCGRGGGGVTMWKADTGEALAGYSDGGNAIVDMAFPPQGSLAAGAGAQGVNGRCLGDSVVRLWQVSSGTEATVLQAPGNARSLAFAPGGDLLVAGYADGSLRLWAVDAGQLLHTVAAHAGAVLGVAFNPDGRTFVSRGEDGTLVLWEAEAQS